MHGRNVLTWLWSLALLVGVFAPEAAFAQTSQANNCTKPNVLFVLNSSQNMNNNNKWTLLRTALGQTAQQLNANSRMGLVMFNTSARVVVSIRDNAFTSIVQQLVTARATGQANHVRAMTTVRSYLSSVIRADQVTGRTNIVVLVTDGTSNDGNPNSLISALQNLSVNGTTYNIKTYVLGTATGGNLVSLAQWAQAGGTTRPYLNTQASTLSTELKKSEPQPKAETCDGADEDCDGAIDENLTRPCTGTCGSGTETCNNGKWENCNAQPAPEVCNARDDDCNGQVDDNIPPSSCQTACGTGTQTCQGGRLVCNAPQPAPEVCDGKDNDCDGQTDESCPCTAGQTRPCGTDTGECRKGQQVCLNGQWSTTCSGAIEAKAELCDGKDNDCDGQTDETLTRPCANGCGSGTETCSNGAWANCTAPTPTTETCDGKDNDCDGQIDENCSCTNGQRRPCGTNIGICRAGTQLCAGGRWIPTCLGQTAPRTETCNGQDDDCDGLTDESLQRNCSTACGSGIEICQNGSFGNCSAPTPTTEICNGSDDDCDGQIDEGCSCKDGETRACGSNIGACKAGTQACVGGQWSAICTGEVKGSSEICDGKDNDCDGQTDENLTQSCANGCGAGTETCQNGSWVNCTAPTPQNETCNGRDDDCDGEVDEGCRCPTGATRPCGSNIGECRRGVQRCVNGQWNTTCEGEIAPQTELCDSRDNDCDGQTDESLSRACSNGCGSGTETCQNGNWVNCTAPKPAPELCNGSDDDCDGQVDEGCSCKDGDTRACGTDTGECVPGVQKCVSGQWSGTCDGEVASKAETCDGLDNDCDGLTDEGLSRACANACGSGTETCQNGKWANCTAPTPATETCNGRDDDCDGEVDEGCRCRPGATRSCGSNVGECRSGTQACVGGQWSTTCTGETAPSAETCDGKDNDCDGLTDENIDRACKTVCGVGTETCVNGVFSACSAPKAEPEVCDGKDNDCDGAVDETLTRSCANACGPGSETCQKGTWAGCTAPTPATETCDGKDNDCDGTVDEGCSCTTGQVRACGSSTGECKAGTQACVGGQWSATCTGETAPSVETCDGKDNDCDGQTDENLNRACKTACGSGNETCVNGSWTNCTAPTPEQEDCDGKDNDCDGSIDENLSRTCSSACGSGTETCQNGAWQSCNAPQPGFELCNGRDDDCDGQVDEGCRCRPGATRPCGNNVGACKAGTQRCVNGRWEAACNGSVQPTSEDCNGQDDDCDGQTDENLNRACKTACGNGTESCVNGNWTNCTAPKPAQEICNGQDDDCDGQTDETLTRNCQTACGNGTETCSGGQWVNCSAKQPIKEICDGTDNDCDGVVDEECACKDGDSRDCASNVGECKGTQNCVGGKWDDKCVNQVPPSPEVCDGKDNDCDGLTDEGLVRACKTACGAGTETCLKGAWANCTAPTPAPETCDGKDNDCDGQVDENLTRSCSNACGNGTETCTGGQWVNCTAPQPAQEICDGKDNDCDSQVDEGCICTPGQTRQCGPSQGLCKPGVQRCVAGADGRGQWSTVCEGVVNPSTEVCDGQDNDCDGVIDEGLRRECTNACGQGRQACIGGKWEACVTEPPPAPETCDGKDNDCDGTIDEGCPCVAGETKPCGLSTGACKPGTQTCVGGKWDDTCQGSTGPSEEVCDGLDNDCDGQTDENLIRECTTACGKGGETCQKGTWTGCTAPQPSTETCDGQDNDCNGQIDDNAICPAGQVCRASLCISSEIAPEVTPDGGETIPETTPEGADVCQNDSDCPTGKVCREGKCFDTCQTNVDCSGGQSCVGGACIAGCQINSDCSSGEVCRWGRCLKSCSEDTQCATGETCKLGQCVPECVSDAHCDPGKVCRAGYCKTGCRADPDCAQADEACYGNSCSRNCTKDDECASEGGHCYNGRCLPTCNQASDCPAGYSCNLGRCISSCHPDVESRQCSNDKTCSAGTCSFSCGENGACTNDQSCVDNVCRANCQDNTSCNKTEACSAGACLSRCSITGDCPDGHTCSDGVCLASCETDSQCQSEQVCRNGRCVKGCQTTTPVDAGTQPDQPSTNTCTGSNVCTGDTCNLSCQSAAQCATGYGCGDVGGQKICVPVCRVDNDCPSTFYCKRGLCASACSSDADCAGETCQNGRCVKTCQSNDDCPQPEVCENNICVTPNPLPTTTNKGTPKLAGGCGCSAVKASDATLYTMFFFLFLLWPVYRRRMRDGA